MAFVRDQQTDRNRRHIQVRGGGVGRCGLCPVTRRRHSVRAERYVCLWYRQSVCLYWPRMTIPLTEEVGAVESVKAASEIFTPVSGKITGVNDQLEDKPGLSTRIYVPTHQSSNVSEQVLLIPLVTMRDGSSRSSSPRRMSWTNWWTKSRIKSIWNRFAKNSQKHPNCGANESIKSILLQ